jgi:ribonuclease HII
MTAVHRSPLGATTVERASAGPAPAGAERPHLRYELALWRAGISRVAGVDEVGRGALAGPLVAAAVVLPPFFEAPWLAELRDSKLLTPARRETLAALIRRDALAVGLGAVSAAVIDRAGLTAANHAAMAAAVAGLRCRPDFLLIDAVPLCGVEVDQAALIDGDACCVSVACAAVVAKVVRDRLMARHDAAVPGYGFARHKGYGTAEHLAALERFGPSPLHRRSFAPLRRPGTT